MESHKRKTIMLGGNCWWWRVTQWEHLRPFTRNRILFTRCIALLALQDVPLWREASLRFVCGRKLLGLNSEEAFQRRHQNDQEVPRVQLKYEVLGSDTQNWKLELFMRIYELAAIGLNGLEVWFRLELPWPVWARFGMAQAEPNRFGPNRCPSRLRVNRLG